MKKNFFLLTILLVMVLILSACTVEEVNKVDESYIAVEIKTIERGQLNIEHTFSGKVYADKDVYVIPSMVAEVKKVMVKVGDFIEKDQILFILDKDNIQKQVDQAYAAYTSANANYELTKEQIQTAKDSYERTKELYDKGVVSKAQYDQALLGASDKPLEAAAKGLEQAKLGYTQALDALGNVEVKAPISGTITSVDIEAGEMAMNSKPAVTIMDLDNIKIEINVTENIINKIYQGQLINLKIDSADLDIESEIASVSSSVDLKNNLYPIKINISNNGKIKAGMFAEVVIKTDIKENVISVLGEAVLEKDGKSIIYVEKDGVAYQKNIKTGLDTGSMIEILSGLNDGDRVIIKGQNYISDGSKVKVVRGE